MGGQAASACAAPSGSEADRETHQGHTALEAGFVLPGLGEFGSTDGDGCHDQVPDCPASEEQSGSGCAAQAGFAGEPTAFASAEAGSVGSTADESSGQLALQSQAVWTSPAVDSPSDIKACAQESPDDAAFW